MAGNVLIRALFCAVILLAPRSAEAEEPVLIPSCRGAFELCGYIERGSQEQRIPNTFQDAGQFSEGLATVRVDGKYGYIDRTGEMVIEPHYDLAGRFKDGLAEVFVGPLAGVIDRGGSFVVEPRFGRIYHFTSDTFLFTDTPRRPNIELAYELNWGPSLYQEFTGGVGLYHVENGLISDKRYYVEKFDDYSRGLIWASENRLTDARFGLLRSDGTWQVTPRYRSVSQLSNGLAVVQGVPDKDGEPALYGAVDDTGKLIIPLQFGKISDWSQQFARVRHPGEKGSFGVISLNGVLLSGRYFDGVSIPKDGRLPRVLENGRWHSLTPAGELVTDERHGFVHQTCPGGLKLFEQHGFLAVSHPKIPRPLVTGQAIKNFLHSSRDCEKHLSLRFGKDQYKVISQDGLVLPPTGWFDGKVYFGLETAIVSLNGKEGVINKAGEFIIPPIYDDIAQELSKKPVATKENDGAKTPPIYRVKLDKRTFWIDSGNNEIEVFQKPPSRAEREILLTCGKALKRFEENGLWGMKGPDGETLIEPRYLALTCYQRGLAWGVPRDLNQWCPIAPDGSETDRSLCRDYVKVTGVLRGRPEVLSRDPFLNSLLWLRAQLDYAQGKRPVRPRALGNLY
nr:WG repeat-containing protein [uncultured Roseibium sp.]